MRRMHKNVLGQVVGVRMRTRLEMGCSIPIKWTAMEMESLIPSALICGGTQDSDHLNMDAERPGLKQVAQAGNLL